MSAPNENAMKAELGGYYMTKGISKREDIEAQIRKRPVFIIWTQILRKHTT